MELCCAGSSPGRGSDSLMSTPLEFQALSAGGYAVQNAPAALCQPRVSAQFHADSWIFQLKSLGLPLRAAHALRRCAYRIGAWKPFNPTSWLWTTMPTYADFCSTTWADRIFESVP